MAIALGCQLSDNHLFFLQILDGFNRRNGCTGGSSIRDFHTHGHAANLVISYNFV